MDPMGYGPNSPHSSSPQIIEVLSRKCCQWKWVDTVKNYDFDPSWNRKGIWTWLEYIGIGVPCPIRKNMEKWSKLGDILRIPMVQENDRMTFFTYDHFLCRAERNGRVRTWRKDCSRDIGWYTGGLYKQRDDYLSKNLSVVVWWRMVYRF